MTADLVARVVRAQEAIVDGEVALARTILDDLLDEIDVDRCDVCGGPLSAVERRDARRPRRDGYAGLCADCLHRHSAGVHA